MLVKNFTLSNVQYSPKQRIDAKKTNSSPASFMATSNFSNIPIQSHPSINFKGLAEKSIIKGLNSIIADELSNPDALIKEVKAGFIEKLAKKLSAYKVKPLVIGIAGEPASGKTTVTDSVFDCLQKLSKDKEDLVTVIHGDSYYEDLTEQLKIHKNYGKLLENGYDPHNPKTQNLDLVKKHLVSLKEGEKVAIPDYLFDSCESIPDKITKNPAKIIINEGIFALNPKLADLCDIKIYVDSPQKLIEQRYIKRAVLRGKTEEEAKKLFFGLDNSTQKYIRSSKEDADLVIRGNSSKEAVTDLLNKVFSMFNK